LSELCELARKYGSDKCRFYTPFYDSILSSRRNSVQRVLELGIGYEELMLPCAKNSGLDHYEVGASLKMWRDYFPKSEVWGLDNEIDRCVKALAGESRIYCRFVDERAPETFEQIADIGSGFDLIVEDGLHEPWAQMRAMQHLMPLLSEDGIYIMEDIMQDVDMTARVPYPCKMKEFGEARIMVIRKPQI
jgi:hypothetical protein